MGIRSSAEPGRVRVWPACVGARHGRQPGTSAAPGDVCRGVPWTAVFARSGWRHHPPGRPVRLPGAERGSVGSDQTRSFVDAARRTVRPARRTRDAGVDPDRAWPIPSRAADGDAQPLRVRRDNLLDRDIRRRGSMLLVPAAGARHSQDRFTTCRWPQLLWYCSACATCPPISRAIRKRTREVGICRSQSRRCDPPANPAGMCCSCCIRQTPREFWTRLLRFGRSEPVLSPRARTGARTPLAHRPDIASATTAADGFVDGGTCESVTGWAWDPSQPDSPLALDLWTGDKKLGTVTAKWFRRDLTPREKGMARTPSDSPSPSRSHPKQGAFSG